MTWLPSYSRAMPASLALRIRLAQRAQGISSSVTVYAYSTRRPSQVSKLDEFGHYRLHITCGSCGHKRVCDPAQLAVKVGWKCPFEMLGRRLRCAKCGARGAQVEALDAGFQRAPKWH